MLSRVAISNLFTKAVAVKLDPRQAVPTECTLPSAETRLLLAQLIFEEAMETVHALGCEVKATRKKEDGSLFTVKPSSAENMTILDIDEIIDGCCDTIYVATGALVACGVPDEPHLKEVSDANDRKFPGGIATMNPETGKYLKPEGWEGPNHERVRKQLIYTNGPSYMDLHRTGQRILKNAEEAK